MFFILSISDIRFCLVNELSFNGCSLGKTVSSLKTGIVIIVSGNVIVLSRLNFIKSVFSQLEQRKALSLNIHTKYNYSLFL